MDLSKLFCWAIINGDILSFVLLANNEILSPYLEMNLGTKNYLKFPIFSIYAKLLSAYSPNNIQ